MALKARTKGHNAPARRARPLRATACARIQFQLVSRLRIGQTLPVSDLLISNALAPPTGPWGITRWRGFCASLGRPVAICCQQAHIKANPRLGRLRRAPPGPPPWSRPVRAANWFLWPRQSHRSPDSSSPLAGLFFIRGLANQAAKGEGYLSRRRGSRLKLRPPCRPAAIAASISESSCSS